VPAPYIVNCASGGLVTSMFVLDRPAVALAIFSPQSHSASAIRVDFSAASAGPFAPLARGDGTGLAFVVASGAGALSGVVPVVGNFGRLTFTDSQVTVCSYLVVPVAR
jgi:hypothetical protein